MQHAPNCRATIFLNSDVLEFNKLGFVTPAQKIIPCMIPSL